MTRLHAKTLAGLLAAGTALAGTPAAAKSRYIAPYIELGQGVVAELAGSDNDDVLTYTSVAVGLDAGVRTDRTDGQISYRYERRFAWDKRNGDDDIHNGLARLTTQLAPGVSLDAGGIATRTRTDIRGAAPANLIGDTGNLSQIYSLYAGPTLSTRAGPLDVGGSYRFGYTKAETSTDVGLAPGEPRLDSFDHSTSHIVQASVGVPAGRVAPFGVTVSGAYEREDASQLDQRYEGYYGRGDVTVPLSATLAVRAGAGYERIKATQRDVAVDAGGNAVLDDDGRYVTAAGSPVRIAYQTDGLIYDAGVIWRPSPRLQLMANAGYRYGGETYFGSLNWKISPDSSLQVVVYDAVDSFGRQLRDGLAALPTSFQTQVDPFNQQFSGCVFATQGAGNGGAGNAGGCLNDIFQSLTTANYRARGVDATYTFARGRTNWGVGGGYANRRLYAPQSAPGIQISGLENESAYGQFFWAHALSRVSTVDLNLYGNWFSSDLVGSQDVYGGGANAAYTHNFGRLGTSLSAGVYAYDQGDFDTQVSAQALLGARYTF